MLCGSGAVLGVLLARPLVTVVGRYAARFSVRALDVTVDASVLWTGAALAMAAAVVLAFVPRLPGAGARRRGGLRITPGTNRRLRAFAITQTALSFVLLAGAGMLLAALVALRTANTGYDMRHVLAIDVPMPIEVDRSEVDRLLPGSDAADREGAGRGTGRGRELRAVARHRQPHQPTPFAVEGYTRRGRRTGTRARGCGT